MLRAWAVTALDRGEIGRIEGKIGMGAPSEGVGPFDQVALLLAFGRAFGDGAITGVVVEWWIGDA